VRGGARASEKRKVMGKKKRGGVKGKDEGVDKSGFYTGIESKILSASTMGCGGGVGVEGGNEEKDSREHREEKKISLPIRSKVKRRTR